MWIKKIDSVAQLLNMYGGVKYFLHLNIVEPICGFTLKKFAERLKFSYKKPPIRYCGLVRYLNLKLSL